MNGNAQSWDLIVVGAGMAGVCTALEGALRGGKVLLLEKTGMFGGSTRMCGGAFAFAGTEVQKENNISDSAELLEEDLLKAGKYRNDKALVHTYAQRQYEAYQWLQSLGIVFDQVSLSGSQSVPRNHNVDPVATLETLHAHGLKAGVEYRANAAVERLIAQGPAQRPVVAGVVLQTGERLPARRGVVLTTGGFSRSAEMVERFVPHLRAARPMGGYGNTGDGLKMAWALGADLRDMGTAKGSFGAPAQAPSRDVEASLPRLISAMYRGAIVVNKKGRRFVDESISYKDIGDRCLEQPDCTGIQVFDQGVMDQSAPLPTVVNFKAALQAGMIKQADSIRELARVLDVDADTLAETVERYNAACDGKQEDEFGRRSLSTGYGKPTRIERGPFYGYPCTTGLTSTYCGLVTDPDSRVLNVYGEPIDGLYASGELMGGFHGESYMSGSSLAKGCIFGRIAAQHALARPIKEIA
jgi:fumarate reductase flavoprotein subunit